MFASFFAWLSARLGFKLGWWLRVSGGVEISIGQPPPPTGTPAPAPLPSSEIGPKTLLRLGKPPAKNGLSRKRELTKVNKKEEEKGCDATS